MFNFRLSSPILLKVVVYYLNKALLSSLFLPGGLPNRFDFFIDDNLKIFGYSGFYSFYFCSYFSIYY